MSVPNHTTDCFHEDDASLHSISRAVDLSSYPEEPDGDCGDIIASMESVHISTPPSYNISMTPSPAQFAPDNSGPRAAFSPGKLPDSPGFVVNSFYYSPPLIEDSSRSSSGSLNDAPARPPAPAFRMMDLPGSVCSQILTYFYKPHVHFLTRVSPDTCTQRRYIQSLQPVPLQNTL
jgi:hypothetical protein